MTLKLRLLIPFVILVLKVGVAQESKVVSSLKDISKTSFIDRTEFKVTYSGNIFWNNGLNFGAEYLLKEYTKVKNRKRGQRSNTHTKFF